MNRYALLFIVVLLIIGAAIGSQATFAEDPSQTDDTVETVDKNDQVYQYLRLFGEAFGRIRQYYVEEVDDETLIYAAINGMLQSLDPHSSFLDPKQLNEVKIQTRGKFGGLGIEVTMEDGLVKVIAPIDDTPAARAGLMAGDFIAKIDNQQVFGLTLFEAVEMMRGEVGKPIILNILRPDKEPMEITLVREIIEISPVRSEIINDVGYVRITLFNEKSTQDLEKAMAAFHQHNKDAGVLGLILDLRNTPGGLLEQAVLVSDAFLESGEIVSTRGRFGDNTQRFNATSGDITGGLPLVVLINRGSASASEIVAGALQDHKRAIIMGTKSFGKGSVQTILRMESEVATAMRLTTALYYNPSGQSIQQEGIIPDIIVNDATIALNNNGQDLRERDLRRSLSGDLLRPLDDATDSSDGSIPKDESTDQQIKNKKDYQLVRAIDLIHALDLWQRRHPAGPVHPPAS